MLLRSCRNLARLRSNYALRFSLRSSASASNVPDVQPEPTYIEKKFGEVDPIYKFTYMPLASWAANLKVYLIPILAGSALFIQLSGEYDNLEKLTILSTELFAWLQSAALSIPVKNLVGQIHTNSKSEIILSYLDYWGNRQDEKFIQGDLSFKSRETGFLKFFRRNSYYVLLVDRRDGRIFRIAIKHANVYDEETLERLLGEIPPTKYDYY